mgnify:CR=1 FL=1
MNVRYGVSYISVEQAKKNLRREIKNYKLKDVATAGRKIWNDELGKIQVAGGTQNDKFVFYTSLYRCLERPVNISDIILVYTIIKFMKMPGTIIIQTIGYGIAIGLPILYGY